MRNYLHPLTALGRLPFTYVDVGGRDGLSPPWSLIESQISVVGFEPDSDECERLNAVGKPHQRFLNAALADVRGKRALYLGRSRGTSSLLKPDFQVIGQFPDYERFETEKEVTIECTTLDHLRAEGVIPRADFIKVDVQGAELDVLRGAAAVLASDIVALECEVEFLPLYLGQPLFADVDTWIRAQLDFQLMDLRKAHWRRRTSRPELGAVKGQLVFGDALYFRSPEAVIAMGDSTKIEAALLVAVAYGYVDYALVLLEMWQRHPSLQPSRHALWTAVIERVGTNARPFRSGQARLAALFLSLHALFRQSSGGWSASGDALGSRKRFFWFE